MMNAIWARTALAVLLGASPLFVPTNAAATDGKIPDKTWVGEITLGGSLATGNTKSKMANADAKAKYRAGRVEDEYKFLGQFAREAGVTTAERFLAGYQTNVDINADDGLFALAFVNGEDDKFSGFQYEIETGIGVGYRILATETMNLSVEGGPGYRYGKVPAPLLSEKEIFARARAKFDYQISDNARLDNEFSISWDAERTRLENTAALTSKIIGSLSGRTSVNVRYNTRPPAITVKKTDTLTKFALVYSF